jgi:hypothetical protein
MNILDVLLGPVASIIEKYVPSAADKAAAQLEVLKLQQSTQLQELQAAVQASQQQTDIDKAEAASSDPLQHWRGGLGWVCTAAYGYNFVLQPLMVAAASLAGHPVTLPQLDIGSLSALTMGMLGLGGLHVAERVKGAS